VRVLRRVARGRDATEEPKSGNAGMEASQAQEVPPPRSAAESARPRDEVARPRAGQDGSNVDDHGRRIGKLLPEAAIGAIAALAAAVPTVVGLSRRELLVSLFGVGAVVAGVLGFTQIRRKRTVLVGASAALSVTFLVALLIAGGQGGSLHQAADKSSSPASSQPSLSSSTHPVVSPSPTLHQSVRASPATGTQSTATPQSSARTQVSSTELKPETATIFQGNSRHFVHNRVLVGIDSVSSDSAQITITTNTLSCNDLLPSVGSAYSIGTPSDGFYRITLLSVVNNKSAVVEVQQLPTSSSSGYAYCPLM
jgi:hypothetical protein